MQRKPGGYRSPGRAERLMSIIGDSDHKKWFTQLWSDVPGASTKQHPAPYPEVLAQRLIRMFSFVGDTVLDPFGGTGTTAVAAAGCGRNSISFEIDPDYTAIAHKRLQELSRRMFSTTSVEVTGL